MRPSRACGAGGESGVALVEFALVAPILLLILLALLDFGKAFNYWIDQTHLASSGARLAVVNATPGTCPNGTTPATLQLYIRCSADTRELRSGGASTTGAHVCITFPPVTGHASPLIGDPVRVTVWTNYQWLPFVGDAISSAGGNIIGEATMRLEAPPTNYTADSASCLP